MKEKKINIVVSPEVLKNDIVTQSSNGYTFGVYSGLTQILKAGPNDTSILTGLTVPIFLEQTYNDIGYYDEFDGFMEQRDVVTNFIVSGDTVVPYKIKLYNTASSNLNAFLEQSSYIIDWGDNTATSELDITTTSQEHTYVATPSDYTITLTQFNAFGTTTVKKKVFVPNTGVTVDNLYGEITFTPQGGSWSGIPINYDYIFTGDSNTNINDQTSNNFTTLPVIVSGYTNSRLNLLRRYGQQPFVVGYVVQLFNSGVGQVDYIGPDYTAYTINGISYVNLPDNKTIFIVGSSGVTSQDFVISGLTKNEALLDFVMDPEVQSEIYVERGNYSPIEQLQRLGEVDNLGDLKNYGYGYFKFFGG